MVLLLVSYFTVLFLTDSAMEPDKFFACLVMNWISIYTPIAFICIYVVSE